MHAIEFLRMDLIGVDHRGLGERQLLAAAPDRRLGSAAGYTGHVEHRRQQWCGDAGNPDPKRVGDKRLGRGMRCLGHLTSGNPCEMRNDSVATGSSTQSQSQTVVPAKAGTHLSACSEAEGWVPALAG